VAILVIEGGIELGTLAWGALGLGGAAVGAKVLSDGVNASREQSRADAEATATVSCWRCDDQTCQRLRREIDGNHEEIRKRTKDLVNDPQNLPYRAAGDVAKPSLSVWGHEQLYLQHQDQLRTALREYLQRRCGPVRAGAWGRATAPIPKKGQFGLLD
jgi:hypothetical protein